MAKYRTKPFEVEAVQFTGQNGLFVRAFVGMVHREHGNFPGFRWDEYRQDGIVGEVYDYLHDTWVGVNVGDYIIKGMMNEFYPCNSEVFEAKYEEVHDG